MAPASVSVLMPCRNPGRFLDEAIDSALADPAVQEQVIADGGSCDGSRERIEARCRDEGRLRLVSRAVVSPPFSGAAPSRC
jgi:glycosyltransferase involved in cell wall biosynthesis